MYLIYSQLLCKCNLLITNSLGEKIHLLNTMKINVQIYKVEFKYLWFYSYNKQTVLLSNSIILNILIILMK